VYTTHSLILVHYNLFVLCSAYSNHCRLLCDGCALMLKARVTLRHLQYRLIPQVCAVAPPPGLLYSKQVCFTAGFRNSSRPAAVLQNLKRWPDFAACMEGADNQNDPCTAPPGHSCCACHSSCISHILRHSPAAQFLLQQSSITADSRTRRQLLT